MPIYEYRCAHCGFEKEFLQKLSDAPMKDCPQCGRPELVKLVSAAGFQLKGSGWYVTDFRNGGKGAAPGKTTDAKSATPAADGGAKSEAKSETKSETKAETAPAKTPDKPASGN